jgi:uncharacterized protein (DUF983 family)
MPCADEQYAVDENEPFDAGLATGCWTCGSTNLLHGPFSWAPFCCDKCRDIANRAADQAAEHY